MNKKLLHFKIKNFLPKEITDELTAFFFDNPDLHIVKQGGEFTKINNPWKHCEHILKDKLSEILEIKQASGQNFFLHWNGNCFHVDIADGIPQYHVLIPLWWPEDENFTQKFIIADQYCKWGSPTKTWIATNKKGDYLVNKKSSNAPYQDPAVCNLVDTDDQDIKTWHDKHFNGDNNSTPWEHFKHLSVHTYEWNIGDVIVFSSNLLHNTTPLSVTKKLGLALQFNGDLIDSIKPKLHEYAVSKINYIDYK